MIALELYAIVYGSDATHTNDGFLYTNGSFISGDGGLPGNFRGDINGQPRSLKNNVPAFSGGIAQSGFLNDVDGDSDLDLGSLSRTGSPQIAPWFIAVGATMRPEFGLGEGSGATEFLIGQTTFTLGAGANAGESTTLNFSPRIKTDGLVAQRTLHKLTVDGVWTELSGLDPRLAVRAPVTVAFQPVAAVPEPTAIGLMLCAVFGFAARRRRA